MRGSMVKYGERQLEGGGGVCEISAGLPVNNGTVEAVEYMCVDMWCMLDWIIGLCQKTDPQLHSLPNLSITGCQAKPTSLHSVSNEHCQ